MNYPRIFEVVIAQRELRRPWPDGVLQLTRGQRLLVVGEAVKDRHGLRARASDPYVLPRMLAHYDSVCGKHAPIGKAAAGSFVLALDAPVETSTAMMTWVMQQLARPDSQFDALARCLRRTECYQLIRYVLGQGLGKPIAEMARHYGLSDVHFYRQSKRFFGQPLKRQLRAHRAASALLDCSGRERNFTQVAIGHGYSSASHFCTEIKSLLGRSPSALYQITLGY